MFKLFWTSVFVFFGTLAMGQITLTRSDFVSAGDQIKLLSANVGTHQPGPAGANQTWDFSSLVDDGQPVDVALVKNAAQTPYAQQFVGANLAIFSQDGSDEGYSYYFMDDSEFVLYGVAANSTEGELIAVYDNVQLEMEFPFSYGDTTSDTFHATFTSQGVQVERTGTNETTADGYGTLIIPQGTYSNALRFKTTMTTQDVAMGFPINTTVVTYSWMVKNGKWPLLIYSIITTEILGQASEFRSIEFQGESTNTQPEGKFLAHVTRDGGGFKTRLLFRNPTSTDQTISLVPYDTQGAAGATLQQTIDSNGFTEFDPANLFGSNLSHFNVMNGDNVSVTAVYQTASGNGASAHIHAVDSTATDFWIYPGEWDLVFDGMALVNRGQESAVVNAEQVSANGSVLSSVQLSTALAPGAKLLAVFGDHFPEVANAAYHITSSQQGSAIFLRGTPPGVEPAYLYANLPQSSPQSVRWVPHVTKPGAGFQTTFYFSNSGSSSGSLKLLPYLADGMGSSPVQVNVPAGQRVVKTQNELFGSTEVGHFQITGSQDIQVSAAYKVAEGLGASAHVNEMAQSGKEFWIYPGETDYIFDGMAAINLGSGPARITATLFDSQGDQLAQEVIVDGLAVFAKSLAVFGTLFPGMDGIIRIQSDQDIMPLFLRGTPPGISPGYLFTNLPLE